MLLPELNVKATKYTEILKKTKEKPVRATGMVVVRFAGLSRSIP
jgi:hypothetical protein